MNLLQMLKDLAPELAVIDDAILNRYLSYASAQVKFGTGVQQQLAICYLAAHSYTVATRQGSAGNTTSVKEGDLAISFGGGMTDAGFNQTSYGQEFVRVRRGCVLAPRNRWTGSDY